MPQYNPPRSPEHAPDRANLSPAARTRLRRIGIPDHFPAVELRAGRIVGSVARLCRLHLFPDGLPQIEVAPISAGRVERVSAHAEGAALARALQEGGARW